MTVEAQLRVDGVWLAAAGLPFSELSWTHRADGGNYEATWSMSLAYGERPAPVYDGALAEVYVGPVREWFGRLDEPGWDDGTFTASGISQASYDYAARTSNGTPTSVPDSAIQTAIAVDGWPVVSRGFSSTAADEEPPENFLTVGAVLDQAAQRLGVRWGVWGDGIVHAYPAPTVFDYLLAPGVIELGETSEERFSGVAYAYLDPGGTRRWGAVGSAQFGHTIQDLTNLGPIAGATAAAIATNVLALGNASPGWTNGVDASSAQLLTPAGHPCEPATVKAGQMIRVSVTGERGASYRDLVIGETKYTAGTDVVSLSPVGTVATNFSDVIEDAYTRITGLPAAS